MTHDDPCDELSDGLVVVMLFNTRLQQMPHHQRRIVANVTYGKFCDRSGNAEYALLMKPIIDKLLAPIEDLLAGKMRDLISNPAIVIQPKRIKYDNPVSQRIWTLD